MTNSIGVRRPTNRPSRLRFRFSRDPYRDRLSFRICAPQSCQARFCGQHLSCVGLKRSLDHAPSFCLRREMNTYSNYTSVGVPEYCRLPQNVARKVIVVKKTTDAE